MPAWQRGWCWDWVQLRTSLALGSADAAANLYAPLPPPQAVDLPPSMSHGALALAFSVMSFMMATHEK